MVNIVEGSTAGSAMRSLCHHLEMYCRTRSATHISWQGRVLRGRAWHDEVLYSKVRHGLIEALRGMALYGTVLSCSVRLCKAASGEVFRGVVSHGGAGSGPAGSSGDWLGRVRRFLARWSTAKRGSVFHGKVVSWPGEVLFGAVGFIGALYSKVRSYCGVVWSVEALHSIVKLCPVKHCMLLRAKALLRSCSVRYGTVVSGFARLRAVGQALVSFGGVMLGGQLFGGAMHGEVRYSWVRRLPK